MPPSIKRVIFLLAVVALGNIARAQIVIVAPTATAPGSLQIVSPITFSITTSGTAAAFVLDEWTTSDNGATSVSPFPRISYTLDGNYMYPATSAVWDNRATTSGTITDNDGFLLVTGFSVTSGQTVTLNAGTYTLPAKTGFNPLLNQTFTGTLWIVGASWERLSNNVSLSAIPEPSTYAAIAGGFAFLGAMIARRRKSA